MKKLLMLALLVLPLSLGSAIAGEGHDHKHNNDTKPYTEIDSQALKEMMDAGEEMVIIDSRGGKYFDGKTIVGAVVLSAQDTNADSLAAVVPTKETTVVFYCTNHDCPASAVAAYKADRLGYTNLYKLPGGIEEWMNLEYPTDIKEVNG